MKMKGLLATILIAIMFAFIPTETVHAMADEKKETLEELFKDIAFAGTISGDAALFEEGENVDPSMAFWYLSMNGSLEKYYNDETWCYELTVSEYMSEMGLAFLKYDEEYVKFWLKENDYYDPEKGDQVSIFSGGFGDVWAWVPTDIVCDGNRYIVNGLYLYGVEETGDVNMATDKEFYDYWMYANNYYYEGEYHSDTYAMGIENAISVTVEEREQGFVIVSYDKPAYYCYENTLYCENPDTKEFDQSYTMILEYKSIAYLGSELKPAVIVRDREGNDLDSTIYNVSYENNAQVGHASVICALNKEGYEYPISAEFTICPMELDVKTSNITSTGKIKLSWDAVDGAEKYEVYRATSKDGRYSLVKTTAGTTYTNTSAKVGVRYYYKVLVYVNGVASNGRVVSRLCDLAQPEISLKNIASSGKIHISWEKVDGADLYLVYRSTSENGKYSLVKTTDNTSYTNTSAVAGKKYYYKVMAVYNNDASANSAYSKVKSKVCDLARPTVKLSNIESTGKIKVSWDTVKGADRYKVYRSTSKNGSYKLMKTTTKTSYTNESATAGKKYYYKVVAVCDANGNADSAYSTAKSRTCDLARTTLTMGATKTGKPKLSWKEVKGATKYEVWRKVGKNGAYEKIYTTKNTSYTNLSVTSGKTYYYKIVAVYGSNTVANSAYSNVVSKKIK